MLLILNDDSLVIISVVESVSLGGFVTLAVFSPSFFDAEVDEVFLPFSFDVLVVVVVGEAFPGR